MIADLVAQIVGPAAERVDVVEILMQALGQQEADDVKIFVVVGGQPARVCSRFARASSVGSAPPAERRTRRERASTAHLRDDGGLQVAVVAHQVLHHFEQIRQRLYAIHEIARGDVARG